MTAGVDLAAIAALVGDPGRANMLAALLDGRAHTASELAQLAGIAAPTASEHLGKLHRGLLIAVVPQGRHRYYRLASAEVARMLETIMIVAATSAPPRKRATPRIGPALRHARSCYDHLAGELGVALADALIARNAVRLDQGTTIVTDQGRALLAELAIPFEPDAGSRRPLCRPCLDWSERRPHLAGQLGVALLTHALATGWVSRCEGTRALAVNPGCGGPLEALLGTAG